MVQKARTLQEVRMVHPAWSPMRSTQGTPSRGWDNLCKLVTNGGWETHQRQRLWFVSCMGHYQTLPAGPVATLTCSCFFGRCLASVNDHSRRKVNVTCFQLQTTLYTVTIMVSHGVTLQGSYRSISNMMFFCLIWTRGFSNIKLLCLFEIEASLFPRSQ